MATSGLMSSALPHVQVAACGAKTRAGHPCPQPAMPNGRCRKHGGKSLSGPMHPAWIDGRRAKHLPLRLRDRYLASADDPDLLSMAQELRLLDLRLNDVLAQVDAGDSAQFWRDLRKLLADLDSSIIMGDQTEQLALSSELRVMCDRKVSEHRAWGEVRSIIQDRAKLVESERKRMTELESFLPADRARLMVVQIADLIRQNVTDGKVLAQINAGLLRIVSEGTSRPVPQ